MLALEVSRSPLPTATLLLGCGSAHHPIPAPSDVVLLRKLALPAEGVSRILELPATQFAVNISFLVNTSPSGIELLNVVMG